MSECTCAHVHIAQARDSVRCSMDHSLWWLMYICTVHMYICTVYKKETIPIFMMRIWNSDIWNSLNIKPFYICLCVSEVIMWSLESHIFVCYLLSSISTNNIYCCVLHWGNFGIQYCCTHFMFLNRVGELKLIQHLINCSLFIQVFLTLLQNRKSPIFLLVGSHSLFRLHILALGLYSYEQQSAEATHFETHLHR